MTTNLNVGGQDGQNMPVPFGPDFCLAPEWHGTRMAPEMQAVVFQKTDADTQLASPSLAVSAFTDPYGAQWHWSLPLKSGTYSTNTAESVLYGTEDQQDVGERPPVPYQPEDQGFLLIPQPTDNGGFGVVHVLPTGW